MKQHDIAGFNLDALSLGCGLDFLAVESLALRQHVFAEIGGHIKQNAARDDRWQQVHTEFLEACRPHKSRGVVAVVVRVINAHVAETINLAADTHPEIQQVVIASSTVGADGGPSAIRKLQHRH